MPGATSTSARTAMAASRSRALIASSKASSSPAVNSRSLTVIPAYSGCAIVTSGDRLALHRVDVLLDRGHRREPVAVEGVDEIDDAGLRRLDLGAAQRVVGGVLERRAQLDERGDDLLLLVAV